MTIREELLKSGFSKEDIDKVAEYAYQRRIPPKKCFFDTKIGRIMSFDLTDYLMNSLPLKLYEKQNQKECQIKIKELEEKGFQGDRNNSYEVLRYEQSLNRLPVSSVQNEDGSFTHTYQDGLQATVKTTLTSIILNSEILEEGLTADYLKIREKRLVADYLGLEEESIIGMEDSKLSQLIGYNEQLKRRGQNWHTSNERQIHKLKQKQGRLIKSR